MFKKITENIEQDDESGLVRYTTNPNPSGYWDYLWCDKNVWNCLCQLENEEVNNENQVVYKSVGILRHYILD